MQYGLCTMILDQSIAKIRKCQPNVPKIMIFSTFSLGPSYRMGRVYKWKQSGYVRNHFKDDQYDCSQASQTPITIHILKAYDESYSKIIRDHKYKDKDNDKDNDKDKDTEKVPETPNLCSIFEILMTHSHQI